MATQTYCNESDLTSRKGTQAIAEITGDGSGQTVDSGKVDKAINDFAERLNGAIRRQYQDLPFDETNDLLNGLNVEGAYLLLVRDSDTGWTEDDREDWKMLMDDVKHISDGTLDLRIETEEETDEMVEGYFSSNRGLFGRSKGLRDSL